MVVTPPDLEQGQREVAILVDASTGVAGKIEPGRTVDVIAAYPGYQSGKRPNRSIVVVAGARVLNVGQPRLKSGGGDAQQDPTQACRSRSRDQGPGAEGQLRAVVRAGRPGWR
jgi:pilus assembly protein CpaB